MGLRKILILKEGKKYPAKKLDPILHFPLNRAGVSQVLHGDDPVPWQLAGCQTLLQPPQIQNLIGLGVPAKQDEAYPQSTIFLS